MLTRAREIVRARVGDGVGEHMVRIGYPGGRPPKATRPDPEKVKKAARERARLSKEKRKAEGRKEVKYMVTATTLEAAQDLIKARGIKGGMTELFETLVAEAAGKS